MTVVEPLTKPDTPTLLLCTNQSRGEGVEAHDDLVLFLEITSAKACARELMREMTQL